MTDLEFRRGIIESARRWIGTPYLHQASVIGVGADCLGLIRGVWREIVGDEPEEIPEYSTGWGDVSGREDMLAAADRWFVANSSGNSGSGDLVIFRWKNSAIARHAGILTDTNGLIHSYEKAGVVESSLGSQWRKRIVATYQFPNPETHR